MPSHSPKNDIKHEKSLSDISLIYLKYTNLSTKRVSVLLYSIQFQKFDTRKPRNYTFVMIKTKVIQLLDEHNIPYRILPHSEPVFTIETAAAQRGVVREEMVKSIVLRESKKNRYAMACLRGGDHLDTQAVRDYLPGAWKRLSFASVDEILEHTGYTKGAVAPLCLRKDIPVVFDQNLAQSKNVNISSGDPMAGIELKAKDLLELSGAIIAPIAAPKA